LDQADVAFSEAVRNTGVDVVAAQTVMREREDKRNLARSILELGRG
jgi:hypothetical protein